MDERPKSMECNSCGREVHTEKDITWIETLGLGKGTGFWFALCRYCRAVETRKKNKYKKEKNRIEKNKQTRIEQTLIEWIRIGQNGVGQIGLKQNRIKYITTILKKYIN